MKNGKASGQKLEVKNRMKKDYKFFEVREYFGETLKNSWIFRNREEAEKYYNLRHNKDSSSIVVHQIIMKTDDKEIILKKSN